MSTTEDVFWLYESNNNKNCSNSDKIFQQLPVLHYTIGDQENKCDISRKTYIKIGDECPICLDPIQTKKT